MSRIVLAHSDLDILRTLGFTDAQIVRMVRFKRQVRSHEVNEETRESLHLKFWRWLVQDRRVED